MMATFFYIVLVTGLMAVVAAEIQCDDLQRNTWSNDTNVLPTQNRTGVCIAISDAKDIGLIHGSCSKFLQDRCNIVLHANETNSIVDSVERAIDTLVNQKSDSNTVHWCGEVFLAIVCNSLYLGCEPTTTLPIGLCQTTCLEYTTRNSCLPFFAEVTKALNETGEIVDLNVYTDCSANHSFFKGANESTNNTCYQVLTGIETLPESTTEVVTTAHEVSVTQNDLTREGDNMRNIAVAYVLPAVCAVVGTSIVVVLVLSGCYVRRLRKRSRCMGITLAGDSYSDTNAFPQLLGVREIYSNRYTVPRCASEDSSREVERSILPVTASTTATSSGASNMTENSAVFQLDLSDWAAVGEGVLIPFERVTITGHLGEGAFGYVVKGLLKDVHANGREYHMPVAMKTLKNCASYAEMRGLLVESSLMHSFSHPHILSLRGLCLNPKSGAPYLVMPFMENGDLRKFLRKKADLTDGGTSVPTYPHGLTPELLARMCCDVAKGMEYLAEKRLVHRDLAARNCMVDRNLRVKVADFGLTREIYEQDYYRQSSQGQLPIKWMSLESLAYRMSNEKTDVWSFGVTCWEVFSLGKVPYLTIDNRDLLDYLDCGRRLSKPRLCNQHVYDVMQQCWKMQPEERPTFSDIVTLLQATDDPSEPNTPACSSSTSNTPHPSLLCSMAKQGTTVPTSRVEMDATPEVVNADEEYVEMSCNESSGEGVVLVVANSSVAANTSSPQYLNVTMSDKSGNVTKSPNDIADSPDKQPFGDRSMPDLTPNNPEDSATKEATLTTESQKKDTPAAEKGEENSGLLDSIINYFQEKTTIGSQESLDRDADTDFLTLQMKEIETTYRSRSASSPSHMTSSLPHSHTHHHSSRSQSTTERGSSSKFAPLVESAEELATSPYTRISIYDECPTTPNVTIIFKTGERVTPADTIFSFSHDDRSQATGENARQQDTEVEAKNGGENKNFGVDVAGRARVGGSRISVVSMPGGTRETETEGGGWRGRLRERFFSYSAGDYVKMDPAPHQH